MVVSIDKSTALKIYDKVRKHWSDETAKVQKELANANLSEEEKQPPVTVNGPIKFAIVKNDFYIQDDQGKEHKLVLVKKTMKPSGQ